MDPQFSLFFTRQKIDPEQNRGMDPKNNTIIYYLKGGLTRQKLGKFGVYGGIFRKSGDIILNYELCNVSPELPGALLIKPSDHFGY